LVEEFNRVLVVKAKKYDTMLCTDCRDMLASSDLRARLVMPQSFAWKKLWDGRSRDSAADLMRNNRDASTMASDNLGRSRRRSSWSKIGADFGRQVTLPEA
jgi:hypothetical protein